MNKRTLVCLRVFGVLTLILIPSLHAATPQFHEVVEGETLSDIAQRYYGNWMKWQDLFSANRSKINDPHWIYPGQRLQILEGADLYASSSFRDVIPRNRRHNHGRSEEWQLLPQQPWERFVFQIPPEVDPQGFDRRSKIGTRFSNRVTAQTLMASDRLAIHGEILSARTEQSLIFLGDQVFVRADEPLQVGTVYSITPGPQKIVSERDGRVGFGYDLYGKVKIVGVRDGSFIGTVVQLQHPLERKHLLIPEVMDYQMGPARAAPNAMEARVMVTPNSLNDLLYSNKLVFIDRGISDGIMDGMIFRSYLHQDPMTGDTISSKDFIIESEIQVLSAQQQFSTAIILNSRSPISQNAEVVALTDLSDFNNTSGIQRLVQDPNTTSRIDELDQMDETHGLGTKENRELRQLEDYTPQTAPEISQPDPLPPITAPDETELKGTGDSGAMDAPISESDPELDSIPEPALEQTPEEPAAPELLPSDDLSEDAQDDLSSDVISEEVPEPVIESTVDTPTDEAPVNENLLDVIPEDPFAE